MIDAVIARLKAEVRPFKERVEGASEFSELVKRGALPQNTPAAHVMPTGLRGGKAQAAAGAFTQMLTETISVLITIRPHDRVGERGLEPIEVLKKDVINALAGWAPDDEVGVFQVTGGRIDQVVGAVVYTVQFSITDQLRIIS